MAGFKNEVMNAVNVNFGTVANGAREITLAGQLMIGTGNVFPAPEIAPGFLTAGTGITITNGPGAAITIAASGGVSASSFQIDASSPPGTNPVVPTVGGLINLNANQTGPGTTAIRTVSLAANTILIQVQRAQAVGAANLNNNGLAHFNNADFTVAATGFVSASGTGIMKALSPDVGANVTPTAGVINVRGEIGLAVATSGLETHNDGTSQMYIENKLFMTKFFVNPGNTVGDRGNYPTLQAAINAAAATGGGGRIYVRGDCIENLSFPNIFGNPIEIIGVCSDGNVPFGVAGPLVKRPQLTGNHTVTVPNGQEADIVFKNMFFESDTQFMTMAANKGAQIKCFNCAGTMQLGFNGQNGIDLQFYDCNFRYGDTFIDFSLGTGNGTVQVTSLKSIFNSGNSNALFLKTNTNQGDGLYQINYCTVFGAFQMNNTVNFDILACNSSLLNTFGGPIVITSGTAGANIANLYHCTVEVPTGDFITGSGTLNYADLIFTNAGDSIDPAITSVPKIWKPWAQTSATAVGSVRGTASFDSASFTVTDGWVQFTGSTGGMTWVDQAASTTVNSNEGNFSTANIVLTLPAGASQGTQCCFINDFGPNLVVQADVADTIRIGNVTSTVGGSATSFVQGDAVCLIYRAAAQTWISESAEGAGWLLA